jgi:mono/diheme cytochrome c family protein
MQNLIQHCNACHQAAGKPYLRLHLTSTGLVQDFTQQTK